MEREALLKVSETISAIDKAERADDVVVALHSLALRLFPVDTVKLAGVVSERYREQLGKFEMASEDKRHEWWKAFYNGVAFPMLARVLLHDVAASWLSCIPHSARKIIYDVYFVSGNPTEVIQVLVPCLEHKDQDDRGTKAVNSNAERLVEVCLLENEGVGKIARNFSCSPPSVKLTCSSMKEDKSRVAQLVASIPDKARLRARKSLSSHSFFKHVIIQLLKAAEERTAKLLDSAVDYDKNEEDGTFQFVGEVFARLCRRGFADIVVNIVIPQALQHVRRLLIYDKEVNIREDALLSEQLLTFWFQMIKSVKDPHAVEKLAERILLQLANEHVRDVEAYWILWVLFSQSFDQPSVRVLFHDKFLLWNVFPLCCLRWILQFAILECPPVDGLLTKGKKTSRLLSTVQCLSAVWSSQDFVQSTPTEQQIYVTAALGLLMEKMSREEFDSTKDVMRSVLEGVSCRLENPSDLTRRTASTIALVFSKVIDPDNPLFLDDMDKDSNIDWEFGVITQSKDVHVSKDATTIVGADMGSSSTETVRIQHDHVGKDEGTSKVKAKSRTSSKFKLVDPDEIIDLTNINEDEAPFDGEDGSGSECSEASSDSSLQPYDLTDDDSDLNKKFTQLGDLVKALRKTDDPDGLERALGIADNLVRASPDELRHVADELVRALVQVRCSDLTVEGEEDSAEEKRHNALVSLLVTCPFESIDTLNKLLYSPHVDMGQRIMILDSMTNAAEELAHTKTIKQKHQSKPLITTTNEIQPWFLPSSKWSLGAGPWKEISDLETPLNWSYCYERELPSRSVQMGKTRRWSNRLINMDASDTELSTNRFPLYAAAFMLPAMQGFDKRRHGVDLLGRDFIVLGKLIYMLGICMKCAALHPEASALATPFLDMLSTREVCQHKEAFVRRSVLFAASCTLTALHPSYVASALTEGNLELSRGLDWIRTWALEVWESDADRECYRMAMACLQLHAQMSLQAARSLESAQSSSQTKSIELPSSSLKGVIKIPNSRSFG